MTKATGRQAVYVPERPQTTREREKENITQRAAQPIWTMVGSPTATMATSEAAWAAGAMATREAAATEATAACE